MTFTIPSIFTAIDKFSGPVKAMEKSMAGLGQGLANTHARSERLFRKLTPALSEAGKQFMSFASAAAIAAVIIGGLTFSVNSIMQYEKAVASFRTIVGGSDKEFSKFQDKINEVARDTKKSSVDTALAFEKIASLNAKFAETAESIGAVSKAAITLSKASGDELGSSAENLVGIMNQFSLGANQANRTINVLAAGAGVGAASITQTAESFVNFGSVAASANITLEQSTALIQTMGKYSLFGAEAGTKLRGSVLKLQQAGVGYASGQFQINDALSEAKKKIDGLKTAKQKDAALNKLFGAENISTGRILLNNIDTYKEFTKGVTGSNKAQEQAEVRANTLVEVLAEFKNAWINMITGSKGTAKALDLVKNAIRFVTDNLDTIISVGTKVLMFFAAWKATLLIAEGAVKIYNAAVYLAEAAQWAWNVAMEANPIGLVIVAIAALGAALVWIASKFTGWGDLWDTMVTGMSYSIYAFSYGAKAVWLSIENSFINAITGMKIAWFQFQNIIGQLSNDQLKKNITNIATEKAARENEIKDNEKLARLSVANAALYTDNPLKFAGGGGSSTNDAAGRQKEIAALEESYAQRRGKMAVDEVLGDKKELVNNKVAQNQAQMQMMETTNNAKVDLVIESKNSDVTAKSDNKSVNVIPTMGTTMKK